MLSVCTIYQRETEISFLFCILNLFYFYYCLQSYTSRGCSVISTILETYFFFYCWWLHKKFVCFLRNNFCGFFSSKAGPNFLFLYLLFWNQIFTWSDLSLIAVAIASRSVVDKYFCWWKRFSSSNICSCNAK